MTDSQIGCVMVMASGAVSISAVVAIVMLLL